jgi:hypothetical protein
MTIDIQAMLDRVVAEVFDETFTVAPINLSGDAWPHGVLISSRSGTGRTVIIRASYEWMDAVVPELGVQTILFDDDGVEAEREAGLRRLCLVMRAYLRGGGRVEQRRRVLRRGTVPVLRIEMDGLEWRLGRHFSTVPDPSGGETAVG